MHAFLSDFVFFVATWLKIFLYFISTNEIIRLLPMNLNPAAEEHLGQLTTNFILLLTDAQHNYATHIVLYRPFYNKIVF